MRLSPIDIISNYLSKLKEVLRTERTHSFLNAEILNRKIGNLLLGFRVNPNDNLDTVTFYKNNDTFIIDDTFRLYENYIRLNIHKITGVTLSEFKSMTRKEQELFLEYVSFKIDSENIDAELIEESISEYDKTNPNNKLFSF